MAESKTPEANYRARTDIIVMEDTLLPQPNPLIRADAATVLASAKTQHLAKMDSEVVAREARAATPHGGSQTTGSTQRGKG